MTEHLDYARPIALMPGEPCAGPCLACAHEYALSTADDCIAYALAHNRRGESLVWRDDPAYLDLLAADDAAWTTYRRMRRAYGAAAAMLTAGQTAGE